MLVKCAAEVNAEGLAGGGVERPEGSRELLVIFTWIGFLGFIEPVHGGETEFRCAGAGKVGNALLEFERDDHPSADGGFVGLIGLGGLKTRKFLPGGFEGSEFGAEPENLGGVAAFEGEVRAGGGEFGQGFVAFGLQLAEARVERGLLVADGLELGAEMSGAQSCVEAGGGDNDQRDSENCFAMSHCDGGVTVESSDGGGSESSPPRLILNTWEPRPPGCP